jgi:serine/threonine-protein kinase RsbT
MTRSLEERVLAVLRRHLSPINAGSVLLRAKSRALGDGVALVPANAPQLFSALRPGVAMFCGDSKAELVASQLQALLTSHDDEPISRRVVVKEQDDIGVARLTALEVCAAAGAGRYVSQKITTAVSELARNIADYSLGGFVEISQEQGRIVIIAEDRGPGIAELDRVLSGTYRSRTGLGRGLRGVRQMMDHTQIETGPDGTRITTEVTLWT